MDDRIEKVSAEIEEISRTEENCVNVMTVRGIGPTISTAMVAAIGEGEAFDRGRDFAAWVGLMPRQYSTGGRTILGRISKRDSRYLRMLFVQAAKIIMMRPHRWPDFSFGDWLKRACERMHRNKAAVALANRFLDARLFQRKLLFHNACKLREINWFAQKGIRLSQSLLTVFIGRSGIS